MRKGWRLLAVLGIVGGGLAGCREQPSSPELTPPTLSDAELYPPDLPWPGPNFLDDRLAGCPTAAEVAMVGAVPLTFDESARVGPLVCRVDAGSADLTAAQKRIYFGLILMKELRFDRPLPWTTATLFEWFLDAAPLVTVFGTEGVNNFNRTTGVTIYLAPPHSTDLRWRELQSLIGVLIHEARHAQGAAHSCDGRRRDNHLSANGAFAYHNYFFSWVGSFSDPSVVPIEYRPHALLAACRQRNAAFCLDPKTSCR